MFDSYADVFAERAGEYHGAMAEWPRARNAEFRAMLDPLDDAADGLVCDMPAGGGYLAHHLRPGLDYVGIEPADGFSDAANRTLRRIRSDLTDVALPDGSVDHVVSLAGLHHERELARVFAEMRRIVRTGGRVVIADADAGSPPADFLNSFVAGHNPQGHDGSFFDDKTPALLEAAGLAVIEDAICPVPWTFASELDAGAFAKRLFGLPHIGADAVADAMARDIGFDGDGDQVRLRWSLRRFICHAL